MMKAIPLRTKLIKQIEDIDNIDLLKEIKSVIDTAKDASFIKLNQEELDEIKASKDDIERGLFIENKIFRNEVKQWLKLR